MNIIYFNTENYCFSDFSIMELKLISDIDMSEILFAVIKNAVDICGFGHFWEQEIEIPSDVSVIYFCYSHFVFLQVYQFWIRIQEIQLL